MNSLEKCTQKSFFTLCILRFRFAQLISDVQCTQILFHAVDVVMNCKAAEHPFISVPLYNEVPFAFSLFYFITHIKEYWEILASLSSRTDQ